MKVGQTNLFSYEALDLRIFESSSLKKRHRDGAWRSFAAQDAAQDFGCGLPLVSYGDSLTPAKAPQLVGDLTAGDPPVPIPNTEVKPRRADGTARESVWERRSLPA